MANGNPPANPVGAANNFVSPQTALSLPVASGAISSTWIIAEKLYDPLRDATWIPVVLAVLIGFAFYAMSDSKGTTWRDRIPAMLSAFFNTVTLAAAALGLSQAVRQ